MASLAFVTTLVDGSQTVNTASLNDADVTDVVTHALATLPDELDAEGKPLPRTPQWALKRIFEGFIAEHMAKVQAWRLKVAAAAAAAVAPIQVNLSSS